MYCSSVNHVEEENCPKVKIEKKNSFSSNGSDMSIKKKQNYRNIQQFFIFSYSGFDVLLKSFFSWRLFTCTCLLSSNSSFTITSDRKAANLKKFKLQYNTRLHKLLCRT